MSARNYRVSGRRIIAFLLVAGGVLGILGSLSMAGHFAGRQESLRVGSAVVSAGLFAWGILTGVSLWRGTARGFRWATFLYALQVPVFSVGPVSYEFSTLLSFRVMAGNTTHFVGANIGSSANIFLSDQSLGFMCGINLVAVIALCCLVATSRVASTQSPRLGTAAWNA